MDSIGGDLLTMAPRPFADEQLAALRALATTRHYRAGEVVLEAGKSLDHFVLVEEGEIEVADPVSGKRLLDASLHPGQFMGELSFLNGGPMTLTMRAAVETRTSEVPRAAMLRLMSDVPEIGDHVLTVFAARRRRIFESGDSSIVVTGAEHDPAVARVASFLNRNRLPFREVAEGTPGVSINGVAVADPTPRHIARHFGLDLKARPAEALDLIIVGDPPGSPPPFMPGRKGCARWWSRTMRLAGRRGPAAGSRITWAFRPASRAATSCSGGRCRQ